MWSCRLCGCGKHGDTVKKWPNTQVCEGLNLVLYLISATGLCIESFFFFFFTPGHRTVNYTSHIYTPHYEFTVFSGCAHWPAEQPPASALGVEEREEGRDEGNVFAHAHKQADAQQKGAHLEERAEQIARQSDTLLWQRGEGGMWQGGSRGRAEEGGGARGGVRWSTLRLLKNEKKGRRFWRISVTMSSI